MLKANFRNFGRAPEKIDRGEFVIQDSALKTDIDLSQEWDHCFSPGQCVEMSMISHRRKAFDEVALCNLCGNEEPDCSGKEAIWSVVIQTNVSESIR